MDFRDPFFRSAAGDFLRSGISQLGTESTPVRVVVNLLRAESIHLGSLVVLVGCAVFRARCAVANLRAGFSKVRSRSACIGSVGFRCTRAGVWVGRADVRRQHGDVMGRTVPVKVGCVNVRRRFAGNLFARVSFSGRCGEMSTRVATDFRSGVGFRVRDD